MPALQSHWPNPVDGCESGGCPMSLCSKTGVCRLCNTHLVNEPLACMAVITSRYFMGCSQRVCIWHGCVKPITRRCGVGRVAHVTSTCEIKCATLLLHCSICHAVASLRLTAPASQPACRLRHPTPAGAAPRRRAWHRHATPWLPFQPAVAAAARLAQHTGALIYNFIQTGSG